MALAVGMIISMAMAVQSYGYGFGCDDGYGYEHAKQDGSDGYRGGDAAVYASIYSFSN